MSVYCGSFHRIRPRTSCCRWAEWRRGPPDRWWPDAGSPERPPLTRTERRATCRRRGACLWTSGWRRWTCDQWTSCRRAVWARGRCTGRRWTATPSVSYHNTTQHDISFDLYTFVKLALIIIRIVLTKNLSPMWLNRRMCSPWIVNVVLYRRRRRRCDEASAS